MEEYSIYSVKNYKINNFDEFIKKYAVEFNTIEDICDELQNDKNYHFRVKKKSVYIFFGDIDGYEKSISDFIKILEDFLKKYYNIIFEKKDFMYTESNVKIGSFHYSIPKWNLTTEKLKEIHTNLLHVYKDDFIKNGKKIIDTTIYSDHWFRCPNQTKGIENDKSMHIIKNGEMKNFVIDYIPDKSVNINNIIYNGDNAQKEKKIYNNNENKKEENKNSKIKNKKNNTINQKNIEKEEKDKSSKNHEIIELIIKLVNILASNYYNDYDDWMKVGMILKYSSNQYKYDFFDLFNSFSKKSLKYKKDEVLKFWNGLKVEKITITIGSLYDFAKKSNSSEYKRLLKEMYDNEKIEITEKYICEKLKDVAGQYFFFLNGSLYSFNNKNNLWYKDTTETIKKYISDDLYDYLFGLLNDSIDDETYLKAQIKELKRYCLVNKWTEELLKTFKTRFLNDNNDDIKFDSNPYLVGFNNGVYDLRENGFRKYEFTDYITTRTGYNYKKSSEEERYVIYELFNHIETDEENRYLLWQILASGLIGICYEKFIIFDGRGGNGKSVTTRLMLEALGDYAYKGSVQTLCTKQKLGANPEIANMNLKRYIIFSEPEATEKIHNSIMKELTGNARINARKLYENKCDIIIPATIVLECNDKIILKNDSTDGEARRIINYTYKSKFTKDQSEVNEKERIFLAKDITDQFIQKYKYAFFDILIEKAFKFINEDHEKFKITESVKKSTEKYISESFCFLTFLNDDCEKTKKDIDYISISDLYQRFRSSDFYLNSSKEEKKDKLSLKKMKEFFESNKETTLSYRMKFDKMIDGKRIQGNNILVGYKFKNLDNENVF
jgi:phage/plasmid-associated DNA primase